jgi:hypothetical protein
MPKLGLEELIFPMLLEKGREKRSEQRRKDREGQVAEMYKLLLNPKASSSSKATAAAGLAGAGASVPFSMLQGRPDLSFAKLPPEVQQAYEAGVLDPQEALKIGWSAGEKVELTPETAEQLAAALGQPGEGAKLLSSYQLTKYLGKQGASDFMGTGGAADKPTDAAIKREALASALHDEGGNLVDAKTMFGAEGAERRADYLANGGSMDELYGVYGMDVKAITSARSTLQNEELGKYIMAGGNVATFDIDLQRWLAGEQIDEKTQAVFDKYRDKATGEVKEAMVTKRVEGDKATAIEKTGLAAPRKPKDFPGTQDDYEAWLKETGRL